MSIEVLHDNPFRKFCKDTKKDWYFVQRKGIDSVKFLLFKRDPEFKIGLVKEPWSQFDHMESNGDYTMVDSVFSGSQDKMTDEEYLALDDEAKLMLMSSIVTNEAEEESGYLVERDAVDFRGINRYGSTTEKCWMFTICVDDADMGKKNPQTDKELMAETIWITPEEVSGLECSITKTLCYELILEEMGVHLDRNFDPDKDIDFLD